MKSKKSVKAVSVKNKVVKKENKKVKVVKKIIKAQSKPKVESKPSVSDEIKKLKTNTFLLLEEMKARPLKLEDIQFPLAAPELHPRVVPAGIVPRVCEMGMDSNPGYYYQNNSLLGLCPNGFPGYQYLAALTLRPEYRQFAEVNSMELTREWITIHSTSVEEDSSIVKEKISIIEQKMHELNLRGAIRLAAEHVDWFGRGQIFVSIEGADISKPLILSNRTIRKGSLHSIKVIEPMWTTPMNYDALNPDAPDFYRPYKWYMLSKEVHASRLLTIITRGVPDMFKPAFNFSGISLSQMAIPYVENWIRTRQSIADLINNFSILALKTDLVQKLSEPGNGSSLLNRAELFVRNRANQGLMLLDKDMEDLIQIAVPLSGLNELQSQAQEHLCTVSGIPAVKLLGLAPAGFNASAGDEIRAFYDKKAAEQESFWRQPIDTIMKIIMLSEFGEIDPTINFIFNPLWQMDKKEEAEIRLLDAQTATAYMDRGVFSSEDIREILARNPESGFNGVDITGLNVEESENSEAEEQESSNYSEGESESD